MVLATFVACRESGPPPVVSPPARLDASDLAVMKALIDSMVDAPHVLIMDTTLAVCDHDPRVFGTPPGGCLEPECDAQVARVLPPEHARTGAVAFEDRNRRRLPIEGSLGAVVTPISATLIDGLAASVLLREHPPGSAIVAFSAPTYPAPRMAVIAYRAHEGAASAARLEQTGDRRWLVVATN